MVPTRRSSRGCRRATATRRSDGRPTIARLPFCFANISIRISIDIVSLAAGTRQTVAHSAWLKGFCWLPDGSGLIYSSSQGSTLLYPPVFNLRSVGTDGGGDRQLTFGDQSYVEPDTHHTGWLIANRIRSTSDIWKIPVEGTPAENTRGAIRVTAQTGQVRTPSPSPDDTEVVYLSDEGGHGNLWVARTDGSAVRQLTFEEDPRTSMGVPKWSPAGDLIAFVTTRGEQIGVSAVHPDGSGLRQILAPAFGPCGRAMGIGSTTHRARSDGQGYVSRRFGPTGASAQSCEQKRVA